MLDSKKVLDSATALKHLIALVGGEALYEAALGTYDLSLAYLVGTHSAMDPGEFVADLKRLQDIESEPLRRADVDARLGRWPSCVENLLRGGDIAGACEVAERRRLFPHALAALSESLAAEGSGAAKESAIESDERSHARTPRFYRVSEGTKTPRWPSCPSASRGPRWMSTGRLSRGAPRCAAATPPVSDERTSIAEEICEALELTDPSSAAIVATQHLEDVDRAVGSLTRAREWRESARVAYLHDRADLVETVVAPCAAEAAQGVLSEATELPSRLDKYLTRLRDLRTRREAMRRAIDAGAEAWRGDRPGGGDDDDAASKAPSLASGVSGMSAYTDRTAGARTATSHARSGVPSTQGGRKPTRKQRRGKKAGAGLRAGGPTEERDLAAHLASGAVAGSLGAPRALEEIGELTELLVSLGHAEDAAALLRAVSDAVAALESARGRGAAARRGLLQQEEPPPPPPPTEEVVVDATKVSVGAHAASKEVQTAAAQWSGRRCVGATRVEMDDPGSGYLNLNGTTNFYQDLNSVHGVDHQTARLDGRPHPPLVIHSLHRHQAQGEHELRPHQLPVVRLGSAAHAKRGDIPGHPRLRRGVPSSYSTPPSTSILGIAIAPPGKYGL